MIEAPKKVNGNQKTIPVNKVLSNNVEILPHTFQDVDGKLLQSKDAYFIAEPYELLEVPLMPRLLISGKASFVIRFNNPTDERHLLQK